MHGDTRRAGPRLTTGRWPPPRVQPAQAGAGRPRVLLLFVDGVGLAPGDNAHNPLGAARMPVLHTMLGGRRPVCSMAQSVIPPLAALDARLGVDGLPQSATGQATILTGVNAASLLGRHRGPFAGADLRPLLAGRTLWRVLAEGGRSTALANAYPDRYIERALKGTGRMGAMARSALLAGVRLRGPADLRAGLAASAFLTNTRWRDHLGYSDLPVISARQAGAHVAEIARRHDFTVFEYYATDIAGHRMDFDAGVAALEAFDRFLGGALGQWSAGDVLVLISDHGNVEDMTTGRHTLNPALAVWLGPPPGRPLRALTDVAPAVLDVLALAG